MISKGTLLESKLIDNTAKYILNLEKVEKNIGSIKHAFESRYSNFQLSYSFKTNYVGAIIDSVKRLGGYAEVVSPFEYNFAKMNFDDNEIIYNGPIPSETKLSAASNGAMVNVDDIYEMKRLISLADRKKISKKIGIGIRVTFDIGNGVVSRFGTNKDSKDFQELVEMIRKSDKFFLNGFHCHIGCSRALKFWKAKAEIMVDLAKQYHVSYIDLGGGMFGHMPDELSKQFDGYVGDVNDYADVICSVMNKAFPSHEVKLIIEPGTAIVGDTMDVESHVTSIKRNMDRTFITVDCAGSDIGFICDVKDLPIVVIHEGKSETVHVDNATIAGNTCLEFDYIKKGFTGDIAVGDTIIFTNVGAYSINNARQFITPRLGVYGTDGTEYKKAGSYISMFGKV